MTLEYSDVLHTMAQVSITLAGFIGLILVFQRGDRSSWSDTEKNTMFHLLFTSLGVFCLSLIPLILQPGFSESITVWRICMPVLAIAHTLGATRALLENRRGVISIPIQAVHTFTLGSYVIAVLSLLVAIGFILDYAVLVYFVGLGWFIAVSVSSFVSLLFHGPA